MDTKEFKWVGFAESRAWLGKSNALYGDGRKVDMWGTIERARSLLSRYARLFS